MASDNIAKLDSLEDKETISGIAGLSKVDGRIYDKQARQDEKLSKFHEKILQDQVLAHIRLLQYHHQLSYEDKKMTCPLQKSALVALYEFYSSKLRPVNTSETSLETLLQRQLLEIIDQPYGIHDDSCNPATVSTIEAPDSPLWDLHDWSLKLTRLLINNGHLSADTADIVENHLVKLLETIQKCQLRGQACPRRSNNIAIIAHCLCKILKMNKPTGSAQRQLLSPGFIQDHLYPLACEFAAREYPASILDPISYYELFESRGKLVEPDEALDEWNRRNERKDAPGKSRYSSHNRSGKNLEDDRADSDDDKADPLPPAHVCLEYLTFKLTVSSNRTDRRRIVKFLQTKVLELKDEPNVDNSGCSMANANEKVDKFALMNKIVALHVLGRIKLQQNSSGKIEFLEVSVLPNLQQDCLLLKICKFQLVRHLEDPDDEHAIKFAQAFLSEFLRIMEMEDYQDEHNKLFVIFASVASECLYEVASAMFNTYLIALDRESQSNLVKKIIALYLDYKIVAPLILVESIRRIDGSEEFENEYERLMTQVIDSFAAELLVLPPATKRVQHLLLQLFPATLFRSRPLPDSTVDRLMRLAEINIFGDYLSALRRGDPMIWQTLTLSYLKCALTFPLNEQNKLRAIDILDRFLEELFRNDKIKTRKNIYGTMILGNLCYYQMTSWSLLNKSATSSSDMHQQFESRHLLFESPGRIGNILESADRVEQRTDLTSSWVMFMLMSWPSIKDAVGMEIIGTLVIVDPIWCFFVELAVTRLDEIEANEGGMFSSSLESFQSPHEVEDSNMEEYETRNNLLFALIAAFNYDSKRLEDHLNKIIRPAAQSSSGRSHILKYVEIWLDVVTRAGDRFMCPVEIDVTFAYRSYVVISYQALINIHRAQTDGKLTFSVKELTSKLNSARQIVLEWLDYYGAQSISHESPLENFYAHSFWQLEAIGNFG